MSVQPPGPPQPPPMPPSGEFVPRNILQNVGQKPHMQCVIEKILEKIPIGFETKEVQEQVARVRETLKELSADEVSTIHFVHTHDVVDWIEAFCEELKRYDTETQDRVWQTLAQFSGVSADRLRDLAPQDLATELPHSYKIAEFLFENVLLRQKT